MSDYSTYLFDVGGTLITFDEWLRAQDYVRRAAQVGVTVSVKEMHRALDELNHGLNTRMKGIVLSLLPLEQQRAFWIDYWADGFRHIGVSDADAVRFASELLDPTHGGNYQKVFDDVVPALEQLKAQGKRMGIISNFSPNCESLLRQLGLAHYFDFFIVSGIIGIEKPDPRIFEAAIAAAGKPASELVYVGDSIHHDVEGANGVDMAAVLIDRADRFPDFASGTPSRTRVRDLRAL